MPPLEYRRPRHLAEVLELVARTDREEVWVWGGGTALAPLLRQGLGRPRLLVGLEAVSELSGIEEHHEGFLRLGATVRLRELERSPLVRERVSCLAWAAGLVGNVRVRNVATLGGHLAHADPAQDLPPVLMVLDARVRLVSLRDSRVVPVDEFFLGPLKTVLRSEELVVGVEIPKEAFHRRSGYVRYAPRSAEDYPTVGVACALELDPDGRCRLARVAVGGAGPRPLRIREAEGIVEGERVTPELAREVAAVVEKAVDPWDDLRGSAAYKRSMAGVWTERLLVDLANGGKERR